VKQSVSHFQDLGIFSFNLVKMSLNFLKNDLSPDELVLLRLCSREKLKSDGPSLHRLQES